MADDDPLLVTQSRLSDVLADSATTFGVYALAPASSLQVLADLRLLAARMLASMDAEAIDDVLNLDVRQSISDRLLAQDMHPRDWAHPAAFSARAPAVITGTGIALALSVLGSESVREAGDRLGRVFSRRRGPTELTSPAGLRKTQMSPAVAAVHLRALSHRFTRSDRLRFRTESMFPRYPGVEALAVERVPAALWRDWCLRLTATGHSDADLARSSLAPLLLVVGVRVSLADARQLLGSQVTGSQQGPVLLRMQTQPLWENLAIAITRLSDYLLTNPGPINYQRRRELSYEELLTLDRWAGIADQAGFAHRLERSWHLARSWLFERVSEQPGSASPFGGELQHSSSDQGRLVEQFTGDVIAMLDAEATRFLHRHGIFDEPVRWSPPLSLVSDLQLPGPDVTSISVAELHAAIEGKMMTVPQAARMFGVSTACIQLALERSPRATSRVRRTGLEDRLKSQLSPAMLARLHNREGLTIHAIAARFDTYPKAVVAVAREYNIEIAYAEKARPLDLDPEWFRREYVDKHRTLTDIADEIGCAICTVSNFAHRQGIPVVRVSRSRPG